MKLIRLLSGITALLLLVSFASCSDNEDAESTTVTVETTSQETTAEIPTTTEETSDSSTTDVKEILKIYNNATSKASKRKPEFSKLRESVASSYKSGASLKAFKSLVYKFMGIGAENVYDVSVPKKADDYSTCLVKSELTADDILNAECTVDDEGNSTVTLSIKDGNSKVVEGELKELNAPIDKSGISIGLLDKDYYDHKNAKNIYEAIRDVGPYATINESYSNAKLTAVIDADGNLTSLVVTFDIAFEISGVYGESGTATASTKVTYSDFIWE